jgi:hypothetical protein
MTKYDEPTDEEALKKAAEAAETYAYLESQMGIAWLESLGNGFVVPHEGDAPIQVILNPDPDDFMQELLIKRGLDVEEIAQGVTTLINESPTRKYTNATFSKNGNLHSVTKYDNGPFAPEELSEAEIDAVLTVATLSAVPARIFDKFGGLKAFSELIPECNLRQFNYSNPGGHMLYEGGLDNYVHSIELFRKGQMDHGDSSRRVVLGSLNASIDPSMHFEGVIKRLNARTRS